MFSSRYGTRRSTYAGQVITGLILYIEKVFHGKYYFIYYTKYKWAMCQTSCVLSNVSKVQNTTIENRFVFVHDLYFELGARHKYQQN